MASGILSRIRFAYSPLSLFKSNTYRYLTNERNTGNVRQNEKPILRPLYMDAQSTTPIDPRVLDDMIPFMVNQFGNPHSRTHSFGWETELAVEESREKIANLIGGRPKEIIFTSGATEANNMAIKGVAHFNKDSRNHVIVTQTEHKCVLDSCRSLESEGFQVTYLPVTKSGLVDIEVLKNALRPETCLVSVMMVNNEIGVLQDVKAIGKLCRERKILFHSDVAQAVGKIPIDVDDMNIDLLSISGHKIYGPKGIGALYVRIKPRVRIVPMMNGGGQERGLRSGTVPTFLAVGLGSACKIAKDEIESDYEHVKKLSDTLLSGLNHSISHIVRNGDPINCYPGCLNLSFSCVEGESLLMALKDIALSSGSACTSASLEPSYVLRAIQSDEDLAHSSIRFGINRFTTSEEVDHTINRCFTEVTKLRDMSPLWDMIQDGIDLKTIEWSS